MFDSDQDSFLSGQSPLYNQSGLNYSLLNFLENYQSSNQQKFTKPLQQEKNEPIEILDYQQTQNHHSLSLFSLDFQEEVQKGQKPIPICQKKKIIRKKKREKSTKSTQCLSQNLFQKHNSKVNPSIYNNMGGFLIGSISQILNERAAYRIFNGNYEIKIKAQWIHIQKIQPNFEKSSQNLISKLKKQIDHIPRRQGAKRDLFKLINTHSKDSQLRKSCKKIIRQEIIFSLNQKQWLVQHAYSRDFKPKGDQDGSKKKERHEAYLKYLVGIRDALIEREQIPKRLNL